MTDFETIRAALQRSEILCQLSEECAELSQAALKLRRAITGNNPTPVCAEDAEDAMQEEIADVLLCIWLSGEYMYGKDGFVEEIRDTMDRKEKRRAKRLKGMEK